VSRSASTRTSCSASGKHADPGHPSSPSRARHTARPLGIDHLEDQGGSYALPDAATVHNVTVEFGHSLGEVVTSAAGAGLVVQQLGEYLAVESDVGRSLLQRDGDGLLRWRQDGSCYPSCSASRRASRADL